MAMLKSASVSLTKSVWEGFLDWGWVTQRGSIWYNCQANLTQPAYQPTNQPTYLPTYQPVLAGALKLDKWANVSLWHPWVDVEGKLEGLPLFGDQKPQTYSEERTLLSSSASSQLPWVQLRGASQALGKITRSPMLFFKASATWVCTDSSKAWAVFEPSAIAKWEGDETWKDPLPGSIPSGTYLFSSYCCQSMG